MPKFICNKLARDKVFELCEEQKITLDAYILDDLSYKKALAQKLEEETQEVIAASQDELLEEIADVQEVIDTLVKVHGFTHEQLRQVQAEKREKKGGLDKKIYVNAFTVDDDSPWKEHFLKQPDKYKLEQ